MEAWAIRQKFRNPSADFGYGGHGNYHILPGDQDGLPDSNGMLWYNPMADHAESRLSIDSNPPRELNNVFPEFKPEKGDQWAEFLVGEDETVGALSTVGYSEMSAEMKCGTDHSMVHGSVTYNNSAGNSSSSACNEEQQSQISDVDNEEEGRARPHNKGSDEIVDSKKKRKRKAERGPRYTFKTKSESDSLEDGYKWRKYGRKFVKSNTNPRSYYRCADKGCDVKKRVERDPKDPGFLITTYEGNHNHESPSVIYYIGKPIVLSQQDSKPAILLFNTGLC